MINPFSQPIDEFVTILGAVFPVLFKLYNIITHQPVSCSERKVHGMSGLSLKHILHLVDMPY